MAIFGGLAQVGENLVTVLANDAQWPEDIDLSVAEAERDRSKLALQETADAVELRKEQVAMRRTLVQIEVSSYPLISGAGSMAKKN